MQRQGEPFIIMRSNRRETVQISSKVEKKKAPIKNTWSQLENYLMYMFFQEHQQFLRSKEERKKQRLFQTMSKEITSRSASQIKSHLQKLIQKHGSYRKMMEHFKIVFKSNPNNLQEDDTSVSRQDSVREETNTIYYQRARFEHYDNFEDRSKTNIEFFSSEDQIFDVLDSFLSFGISETSFAFRNIQ